MGFVIEEINGERRVVDHERDISFIKMKGPSPDGDYDGVIMFKGTQIGFRAQQNSSIYGIKEPGEERKYEMKWHVYRLYMPDSWSSQKISILKIIEECLHAYAWNFRPEKAHSVSVLFDQKHLDLSSDASNAYGLKIV